MRSPAAFVRRIVPGWRDLLVSLVAGRFRALRRPACSAQERLQPLGRRGRPVRTPQAVVTPLSGLYAGAAVVLPTATTQQSVDGRWLLIAAGGFLLWRRMRNSPKSKSTANPEATAPARTTSNRKKGKR